MGTRLRSRVSDRPKVLAPLRGEPFLALLLDRLARAGVTDVVLSAGYLGEMIEAFAGDGSRWGLRLRVAREPEPLGTGGGLRFAADAGELAGPLLVLNGDTFFSGDLRALVRAHAEAKAAISLAVVRVEEAGRYGSVERVPETGEVLAFGEKDPQRTGAAWINAGVYVVDRTPLTGIPPDKGVSLERDVFPAWIGRGLFGFAFPDAAFLDMGTPEDYDRAAAWLSNLPPSL